MPVLTKINSNVIADDAITGDKVAGNTYLSNTATENISGTYSENRLYTSDAYTLSGNSTINSHITLSSVKPNSDVVLTADGARTITGTGTLSGGSLFAPQRVTLTGMTGELGSAVTGISNNADIRVNSPSFVARHDGALSLANEVWTGFGNTIISNYGGCYDASTYRFTPNKEGMYFLHVSGTLDDVGDGKNLSAGIAKNGNGASGSELIRRDMRVGHSSGAKGMDVSTVAWANGSTDYFFFALQHAHGSNRVLIGQQYSRICAFRIST